MADLTDPEIESADEIMPLPPDDGAEPAPTPDPIAGAERIRSNLQDIQGTFRKEPAAIAAPATSVPPLTPAAGATPTPPPTRGGDASQAVGRFKSGKDKFGQALNRADKINDGVSTAKDLKENGIKDAKEAIKAESKERVKEVAKEAVKKAARAAAEKAVAWGARALAVATSEVWVPVVLGFILLVLTVIVIIFALYSFGGHGGGGLPILPSSIEEKYAATSLLALSNDPQAKAEVITTEAKKLRDQLVQTKKNAVTKYGTGSAKATAAAAMADDINGLLDQIIAVAVDPAGRIPLINQANTKFADFQKQFSELFFTAGKCADLKPFIDKKQFVVLKPVPNEALIIKGQMMNNAGQIWPASQDLCSALVAALNAGYKITTGTLSYGHKRGTVSGNQSRHWCGAAIDISHVNGRAATSSNDDAAALTKFWYDAGHAGQVHIGELIVPSAYKKYEMKNNADHQYGSKVQAGHETHIHLAGRVVDKKCLTQ